MKLLSIASLLFAVSAFGALHSNDRHLMVKLGRGDTSEVGLARIVEPKATDHEVREFAHRMISDHSAAFDQLREIARHEHVRLEGGMDAEHQRFAAKLRRKRLGAPYDRTYIEEMVQDHRKDRQDVREALREIRNPDLKAWAENELKTIEEHLHMAQEIERRMR
jgi:putative membrane protein